IVISRETWQKTGSPAAYQIFFDDANQRIGLKPTAQGIRGSYPAGPRGRHGGRRIIAYRLIAECRLILKYTLQFPLAEVDPDGILILDLRTAVANPKSVACVKKREASKPKTEIIPGELVERRAEVDSNP
ncbi:MAG: hypothetical protein PSX80_09805, partial [bacterium]|nr:hypothetical protein [bacterium]